MNCDKPPLQREGDRASGGRIVQPPRHSEPYPCQTSVEISKVTGEESHYVPCCHPKKDKKSIEQSEIRFLHCLGSQNQTPTPNPSPLERGRAVFTLAEVFSPHFAGQRRAAFTLAEVFTPHSGGQRKIAFTLAEVLITLGIIGVVAAMTLPSLIQKQNEREIISRLQKSYSVLSQALVKSQIEYGFFETWENFNITNFTVDEEGQSTDSMKDFYYNIVKPELKVVKECEDTAGCWHKGKTVLLNGSTPANSRDSIGFGGGIIVFRLADGTNIEIDDYSAATLTNHFGVNSDAASYVFLVDANGDKKPNQFGRDIFIFVMTKKGLQPAGKDLDNHCSLSDSSGYSGFTCAARVLASGKIDY